jgi:hypothetical protein
MARCIQKIGKSVVFITILLFFPGFLFAQTDNGNCETLAPEYATRFSELIKKEAFDQMPSLLFRWEQECPGSEPLFRARTLFLIFEKQFNLAEQLTLEHATAFEIRHNLIQNENTAVQSDYFNTYPEYFGFIIPGGDFDRQTRIWARRLQSQVAAGSLSFLLLKLYEGETQYFFHTLRDGAFDTTSLAKEYNEKVNENLRRNEINVGVSTGIWIPSGELTLVGVHPAIGVLVGAKTRNTYWDAIFEFRFGNTRYPFEITIQDSILQTQNYQGGYLGLEASRIIKRFESSTLEIIAGLGYDIIDIVEDSNEPERQTFRSPAANAGLGYRFFFPNRTWLSFKTGYYWLDHSHDAGSPLSGNAFMLKVSYGLSENARKTQNLKRLGVHQWW